MIVKFIHALVFQLVVSFGYSLHQQRRRSFIASIGSASLVDVTLRNGKPGYALSGVEAEYDSYASSYDNLDGGQAASALGIDDARRELMRRAKGRVLEIGVGTGLNLNYYDVSHLESLTLVDISDGMLQQAKLKVTTLDDLRSIPVKSLKADATSELVDLFGEESFDTVVDTFSLCVMGNAGARDCLAQMSRVVTRYGRLLLLENSRSSNVLLGLYQDVTADAAASAGGKRCVYNQDVAAMIRATGRLEIELEKPFVAGLFRSFVCRRNA